MCSLHFLVTKDLVHLLQTLAHCTATRRLVQRMLAPTALATGTASTSRPSAVAAAFTARDLDLLASAFAHPQMLLPQQPQ